MIDESHSWIRNEFSTRHDRVSFCTFRLKLIIERFRGINYFRKFNPVRGWTDNRLPKHAVYNCIGRFSRQSFEKLIWVFAYVPISLCERLRRKMSEFLTEWTSRAGLVPCLLISILYSGYHHLPRSLARYYWNANNPLPTFSAEYNVSP